MSIPSGIDCPGAELVHRVKEVVADPDTLVIVNCAGRTRSIIGAQSLINAGLENRVVALENGTMGWQLAGHQVASGSDAVAPPPSAEALAWSRERADAVRRRFGVEFVDEATVDAWSAERERTTIVFDVRSPDEFEADHRPGTRNAPGGQLVQSTDAYVATMNARLVLVDDDGVRASMTASWIRQMGWHDTFVMPGVELRGASGPAPAARPIVATGATMTAQELLDGDGAGATVIDLASSLFHRRHGHLPGAHWAVRSRLAEARRVIGDVSSIVLTSDDGVVAELARAEVESRWPGPTSSSSRAAPGRGSRPEVCPRRASRAPTTTIDDIWYKPYDHDDGEAERHMQDYLTWEVALVEQLERDDTVRFPDLAARRRLISRRP